MPAALPDFGTKAELPDFGGASLPDFSEPITTGEQMQAALAAQGPSGGPMPPYQNTTEGLEEVVNDPGTIPAFVMGAATIPGKVAYHAAADVISKVAGQPEYGGNLLYGDRKPWQAAPVDVFLDEVSHTNPNLAVAGKVGRSLAEMSPLAAVGMLPSALAKLAAAGFSVDMIRHAPAQFEAFADEINKPIEEQDPAKLSTLKSDILQTFAFAPLAGAHGVAPALKEIGYALDLARANAGPRARAAARPSPRPMMPAEEGSPVPTWEATEALPVARVAPETGNLKPETPLVPISPAGARQSDVARSAEAEAAPAVAPNPNLPAWVNDAQQEHYNQAVKLGVKDKIVELANKGLVARQIVNELNLAIPFDEQMGMVRSVRNIEKIPSADEQLPPTPETTPAQNEVAPPRAADATQAASAPGAGETLPAPTTNEIGRKLVQNGYSPDEVAKLLSGELTPAELVTRELANGDLDHLSPGEQGVEISDRVNRIKAIMEGMDPETGTPLNLPKPSVPKFEDTTPGEQAPTAADADRAKLQEKLDAEIAKGDALQKEIEQIGQKLDEASYADQEALSFKLDELDTELRKSDQRRAELEHWMKPPEPTLERREYSADEVSQSGLLDLVIRKGYDYNEARGVWTPPGERSSKKVAPKEEAPPAAPVEDLPEDIRLLRELKEQHTNHKGFSIDAWGNLVDRVNKLAFERQEDVVNFRKTGARGKTMSVRFYVTRWSNDTWGYNFSWNNEWKSGGQFWTGEFASRAEALRAGLKDARQDIESGGLVLGQKEKRITGAEKNAKALLEHLSGVEDRKPAATPRANSPEVPDSSPGQVKAQIPDKIEVLLNVQNLQRKSKTGVPLVDFQVGELPDGKFSVKLGLQTSRSGVGGPHYGPYDSRAAAIAAGLKEARGWIERQAKRSDTTAGEMKELEQMRAALATLEKKEPAKPVETQKPTKPADDLNLPKPGDMVQWFDGQRMQSGKVLEAGEIGVRIEKDFEGIKQTTNVHPSLLKVMEKPQPRNIQAEIDALEARRKAEAAKPRRTNRQIQAQRSINMELQDKIDALKAELKGQAPAAASKQPWEMTRDEYFAAFTKGSMPERRRSDRGFIAHGNDIVGIHWWDDGKQHIPAGAKAATYGDFVDQRRQRTVAAAMREGLPVPAEVLAEYPKLKVKASAPAETPKPAVATTKADTVLNAGNVNTDANVRAAQEAKPLGEGSKFSAAEAKEQKKFLLDAIDQAVAEAPAERPKNAADADAAAVATVKSWKQGDTAATFEARRAEVLNPLFEKYNIPERDPMGGRGELAMKREARLDAAIEAEQTKLAPKVTIEVPGDGVFTIVNSKKALADFKERAAKFPTSAPKAKTPSTPRSTPTPPAALGKPDPANTIKALRNVVSDDASRGAIQSIWSDGKNSVATNGWMITLIRHGLGGTEAKPKLTTVDGKEFVVPKGERGYPDWKQVVPKDWKADMRGLDTQKLFTVLRQAQEATSEKSNSVVLWRNKDGSLGVTAHSPDEVSYSHNYVAGAKAIAAFDPKYLLSAINSARSVGDSKIDLSWIDELAPAKLEGKNSVSVVMPMRMPNGQPLENKWTPDSGKKPSKSSGTAASPPALGGGDLGAGPRPPGARPPVADDPRHSVFDAVPMEMPEAVQAVKLFTGIYPKIRQNLGRAAGLFRFTQGEAGKGQVELLARIFDLLDENDKAKLREEARNYAEAEAPGASPAEQARVAAERYQYLLEQAYEEAKRSNPKQAMKVMWHEIGHVVDWLPDHIIRGRGNFFGRIASLKNYLKGVLPLDPNRVGPFQEKPTPGEVNKLRKEAYDAAQAEIGPMREIIEKILVEEPIYREAGITVDMVKKLMGMDARETMPELYKWFAEQDGKVKAEIVRAAMKGLVDERLKSVAGAGREQIGTRTIEREVRRREGRPPTPDEVAAKFKELFRQELERRNIADLKTVKAELEPLIAWWRGTAKMERYFATSEEMYAEAFSVFANNPAALEARAPTYAKLIWNYLDRKPQVKALYDQIQADIKAGTIMPKRIKALWQMWDNNDAHSLEIARDAGKLKGRDVLDNVQYHLDRRFGPVYRAARGAWQGRISTAIGNFLYRMSEHERYLAALNHEVGKRLVAKNLDWSHDLGEYLFHKRIEMERFNMANPLGWTSKNSLERLAEMREALGPERWAALEEAGAKYREQYEKFVVAELDAAQMFTPELQQVIQERAHYATFAAIKGVADTGIEKLLESRFGASVTPHIFKQIGNLGEIKNPATATVLKGLSLISAAYRNTMKREVVKMLQEQHPEDIMPARTRWNGKAREAVIIDDHPAVGTIVYLDRGQPQAFYVRRVMSDAVNSASGADNLAYSMLLNATGWQKGLFTQLNYGFWPVNFVKDVIGWTMQMPGLATPYYWAKNLPKALIAARQSVTHSKPNPYADAALRRKMLISKGDPRGVWAAAENEYEMKLASFGMDPVQWKGQADGAHRLVKLWDWYKNLGQTVERVNKISGMIYLDEKFPGMPEWKKREIVRERGGSPNFLERGASNPAVDLVALFYNPWKEGLRSLGKSARENPWSFAAKGTAAIAMPTVLAAAAVNGWLGADRQEQYKSIPDYDLTNYLCVPLGWVNREQRKVYYLRLPLWEPARIAHGTLFQALTNRGQGMAAHVGGQLPGLNPIWKIGLAWASYMQGKNPVDVSRGVPVMPDKVFEAGGPATLAEMAKYTWNEAGGSILNRFKNLNLESSPESEGEKFLSVPGVNNALGRWLKVSDRGLADQQRGVAGEIGQERAQIQLGVDEILRKLTGEGSWDNLQQALKTGDANAMARAMTAAALTDSERMLMREPYALEYFTRKFPELVASKANVNARLWFNAQSTEERAKLIQKGIIQPPAPAR
jgi:hypothetical protein